MEVTVYIKGIGKLTYNGVELIKEKGYSIYIQGYNDGVIYSKEWEKDKIIYFLLYI